MSKETFSGSTEHSPLVSIGMPIYNEECFIENSLKSVLTQDYKNIEIILSDNASTDKSAEICQQFVAIDSRISFHQFSENKGVTPNFQYVLDQASGTYFMWASGHDLWSHNLVSECVKQFELYPNSVIAFGSSSWISGNGGALEKVSGWTDTRGMSPTARFFTVFWGNMHPVLGLMRTKHLRETGPLKSFAGADLVLLSKIALKGDFIHAIQTNWFRREFRQEAKHADKLARYRSSEYGLIRSFLDRFFPLLKLPVALIGVIIQSKLSLSEKAATLVALISAFPLRYLTGKK